MKRLMMMVAVLMLSLCIPSMAVMQELNGMQPEALQGSGNRDSATMITVSKYAKVLTCSPKPGNDLWYRIQAPADGKYVICFEEQSKDMASIEFKIYGDATQYLERYMGREKYTAVCEVKRGDNLYLRATRLFVREDPVQFSVCFDGYHLNSDTSEVYSYPTCTENGTNVYLCLICGKEGKTEQIPRLPHTLGDWQKEKNPRCTTTGLNAQRCTVCGEIVNQQEIPAMGHGSSKQIVTKPASCMEAGVMSEQCTICLETLSTQVIPMGDHTPGIMKTVMAASCTMNGRGEQRCTVCNTLLKEETTAAYGHNYSEWETIVEPTKNSTGQKMRYCRNCADVEYEEIEKLPKFLGIF